MKAKLIALGIAFVAWVFPAHAGDQIAQARILGQCEANFQACYNVCRIQYPEQGFQSDQNRVACGNSCLQVQNRCLGVTSPASSAPSSYAQPPYPVAPTQRVVQPSPPIDASGYTKNTLSIRSQDQTKMQPKLEERESGIMAPIDNVIGSIFSPLPAKRKKKFKR